MKHSHDYDVYLVGLGWDVRRIRVYWRQRNWFGVRYSIKQSVRSARRRSWWGIWQMEWLGCEHAVRGLTRKQAYRRGIAQWTRDYETTGGG